jgi:hypothetical protein
MADAAAKITIFFVASGGSTGQPATPGTPATGWTETFYSPIPDLDTNLNTAKTYVQFRRSLLGVGAGILYIRVAAFPLVRATLVNFALGKVGTGTVFTNSPADDYDPTEVDLLVRMDGQNNSRRQFWMGGLPDSQTDTLLQQGMNGAFINSPAFQSWTQQVMATGWGIRQKVRGSGSPGSFNFELINRITPIMVRRRDRGRPFYLFRGRRLA